MKLATYDDGSRDGQLVVVSRDLSQAHYANGIASRLQQVLDDWNFLAPQLEDLSVQLNQGRARHAFAFEPARCLPPLPRPHASRLTHEGRSCWWPGAWSRAGHASVTLPVGMSAVEASPGVAAVTGDVAAGTGGRDAIESVRLLMLVQGWWPAVDGLPPEDVNTLRVEPLMVACAPVLVTPDELGDAWRGGRLRLPAAAAAAGGEDEAASHLHCQVRVDGRRAPGRESALPRQWPQEGHLGDRIADAARRHALGAGSVVAWIGSPAQPAAPVTGGQRVRIEMLGPAGLSVFGATDQRVGDEPTATAPTSAAQPLEDPPAMPAVTDAPHD